MTKWTDEKIARVETLWKQGLSCTLIGREFGVSRNAIIGLCHRRGLRRDEPIIPIRDSAKWTPDMDATIRAMSEDGKTRTQMAEALDLTYNQVLSRCRTLNLKVSDARTFTVMPFSGVSGRGAQSSRRKADLGTLGGPAAIMSEAPDPNVTGLTCIEMPARGACRWPISGAGAGMIMCGHSCGESTYCVRHDAIAFTPPATTAKGLYRSVRRYA